MADQSNETQAGNWMTPGRYREYYGRPGETGPPQGSTPIPGTPSWDVPDGDIGHLTAPPSFDDEVIWVLNRVYTTLRDKRHDYGAGNLADFGELGILVRQGDKYHRLKNLLRNGDDPLNESIDDTWLDMIGYAVLALILRARGAADFTDLAVEDEPRTLG